ncbi:branched-chain amino acid ABC transporter permease [Pyrobaculum aerophilum]|uniref:Branched-chain amino acid ABC transporter permease n=1 Tax=Pyrobaculum aerophilum TaxID=13773 RepID=A0A371QZB1_9CREN|nr:branched-chain amino acid ABC transporter permease [Pyrobaculum aerophilum]RFA96161.1 branched-chain amino acid ABC transporter permease [Pyrobaculum aerophilum]RFA96294.1 branched-chain amino acid ABC transporter permease [Pyrobaculum aerophilum]
MILQIEQAIADILAFFAIYAIVALALNLAYGYAGVPNFGLHMAVLGGAAIVGGLVGRLIFWLLADYFTGVGLDPAGLDYVANNALIVTTLNKYFEANPVMGILVFLVSLIFAIAVGALLGYLLALPAARLREEYLAMATLAIAEVFFNVMRFQRELIGGTIGVQIINPLSWLPERYILYPLLLIVCLVALYLFIERIIHSPLGRGFKAVRDDDIAASTLGYDVAKMRELSMTIAGAIGGLAGALWAFYTLGLNAINYNRVYWTFIPWLVVILGGTANNAGVIVGALIYISMKRLIIFGKEYLNPYLPFDVAWLEYILVGVIILAILIYRPQGLIPERLLKTLKREEHEEIKNRSRPEL